MSTELSHIEEAISLQRKYLDEGRSCYEFQTDGLSRNELFDCILFIDISATRDELSEFFRDQSFPLGTIRLYPNFTDVDFFNRCESFGIIQLGGAN